MWPATFCTRFCGSKPALRAADPPMLYSAIELDEMRSRVETAIAEFERRPDRNRWASLLAALHRQREQLLSSGKREG